MPRGEPLKDPTGPRQGDRLVDTVAVVGALLTIIGLVMIPLPGPGFILLFPGAGILAAGVALRMSQRLSRR